MSAEPAACSAAKRCVPCESLDKSHLLTEEQVASEIAEMKLWRIEGSKIVREYTAKNFQAAIDSLNAVGVIAERENHHPDFHLTGYRNVRLELYTHSLGGLSQNDISLAKMIDDEVKVIYSPKWLKSHPDAG